MTEKDPRTPEEVVADLKLKEADLALKALEADKVRAEARKQLAEAIKAEQEAEAYQMDLAAKKEKREHELASDHYAHIYRFNSAVNEASVKECINRLTLWSRIHPGTDIEIIFNSPGGSVTDGMALFDFIQDLRRGGHRVTTTARGIAASMAGILLQAGDVRRMGKEAWVLIHQASFGSSGSFGAVEDTVEWVRKVQERIIDIFAARAAGSGVDKPITRNQLKKSWERKDWWLSSDECLKLGIVDEVC